MGGIVFTSAHSAGGSVSILTAPFTNSMDFMYVLVSSCMESLSASPLISKRALRQLLTSSGLVSLRNILRICLDISISILIENLCIIAKAARAFGYDPIDA